MHCDLASIPLSDGRWRHTCRREGCTRGPIETASARMIRECNASIPGRSASEGAQITLRSEDDQARLAAICRSGDCGQWDAAEEGCRRCGCGSSRHDAWLSKLRIGNCPLKRWPDD